MTVGFRHYNQPEDYHLVDQFLIRHHQAGNVDGNWLEPAWEYMHGHPYLDRSSLEKIGIWEGEGEIVAVAHYESRVGEAFFQFHPKYRYLRQEMITYAEYALYARLEKEGIKYLHAFINEDDSEFVALVKEQGYERNREDDRTTAKLIIPDAFPSIRMPEGFGLKSLADDCDWSKVHRLLWRGFGHEGEPPTGEHELEERRKMFDTPKARRDLKIVVIAPNGDYVSICGMFYQPNCAYAYVEPVATDPAYRRLGLGRAAVIEGIRRCRSLGAKMVYVGSDQEFYLSMGFHVIHISQCWFRTWNW
jgi:GNAT superfamily N-acetyltransferase